MLGAHPTPGSSAAALDRGPAQAISTESQAMFAVTVPAELLSWLQRLLRENVPLSLSAPNGASLASTLWTIDAEHRRLGFDAGGGSPQLANLVESDDVTAVAYLDEVKLQFDLHDLMLVHGQRASALQAGWPQCLYRFQRRASYRVRTQTHHAPMAEFRHPNLPDMRIALRVLDLSIGGCALMLPDNVPLVPVGVAIAGARLRLDADTRLDVSLQVHHLSSIQPGPPGQRLGCSLSGLSGQATRTLQRHIDQTQKRQRLAAVRVANPGGG